INYILYKYLNVFMIAYLDNILVYISKILKEDRKRSGRLLEKPSTISLYLDIKKYKFKTKSTKYLEFIIKVRQEI
ncbi:hypothetical protein K469DRAFT_560583, partial [Zopfia rhizophila CBS 207.26]